MSKKDVEKEMLGAIDEAVKDLSSIDQQMYAIIRAAPRNGLYGDLSRAPRVNLRGTRTEEIIERLSGITSVDEDTVVVVASLASEPKGVLGASAAAQCCACNEKVWVSPSSKPHLGKAKFVCTDCIYREAAK